MQPPGVSRGDRTFGMITGVALLGAKCPYNSFPPPYSNDISCGLGSWIWSILMEASWAIPWMSDMDSDDAVLGKSGLEDVTGLEGLSRPSPSPSDKSECPAAVGWCPIPVAKRLAAPAADIPGPWSCLVTLRVGRKVHLSFRAAHLEQGNLRSHFVFVLAQFEQAIGVRPADLGTMPCGVIPSWLFASRP